jgi:hypothetical protein
MNFQKAGKLGIGAAAIALFATVSIGSAPAPSQLPTVTVHANPT